MSRREHRPITRSLQEYGRGIAGGLMFSVPLLYTSEVWSAGSTVSSFTLLICTLVTFFLLMGYNRYGGMRPGSHLIDVAIDSIEEMGIGLLLATIVLLLLGRVEPGMPHREVLGKIILEAMIVSIGVSVGTAQLGSPDSGEGNGAEGSQQSDGEAEDKKKPPPEFIGQLVLAFCGAVLFAANFAPTEEVVTLAIEAKLWQLLALVAASLLLGALILHHTEFAGSDRSLVASGGPYLPLLEPMISYAMAIAASIMMLWLFRRFEDVSWGTCVAETVVLGFGSNLVLPQEGS